jgi:hypothetical protein
MKEGCTYHREHNQVTNYDVRCRDCLLLAITNDSRLLRNETFDGFHNSRRMEVHYGIERSRYGDDEHLLYWQLSGCNVQASSW